MRSSFGNEASWWSMEALAYYRRFFDRNQLSDVGAMLVWCRGASMEEVVVRLGAKPGSGVALSVRELCDGQPQLSLAVVFEVAGTVLVVDPFAWTGTTPELMKRLSEQAALAVGVHWNVEGDNRFTVAEDGVLVVEFDMRDPNHRWGRDPDRFGPLMEEFDTEDWEVAGLALAECIGGARLPEDWWSLRGLGVRVVLPPQDLVPDPLWNHPVLEDPVLAAILADPRPDQLPLIARIAAETAVRHTGLEGDSVSATLAWLQDRNHGDERSRLQAEMARISDDIRRRSFEAQEAEGGTSQEGSLSRSLFRQADAALALSEALGEDITEAATRSVSRASRLGLGEDDSVRLGILQRCAHRIRWG